MSTGASLHRDEGVVKPPEPAPVLLEAGRDRPSRLPIEPPISDSVRLSREETLAFSLARICVAQLDRVVDALGPRTEREEGIHTARKAMKRIRALLRLCRGELGKGLFQVENVALRDAARRISPARDAVVLLQTLDSLSEAHPPEPFADLRPGLARLAAASSEETLDLAEVIATLHAARSRYLAWPAALPGPGPSIRDGYAAIAPGLRRTFRRGKRAMAASPTSPRWFHEWRKQAKYLRYQLETLQPLWPEVLDPMARSADELADELGMEHDLAVLAEVVTHDPDLAATENRAQLLDLIARRQDWLRRQARDMGARIYAEAPAAFTARIGAYWEAWRG